MLDAKKDERLFGFSTPSSLVHSNTVLSPGLVPPPVCSSQQASHGFGISNILCSPMQPRLHFSQILMMAPLASVQELPCYMPNLSSFPYLTTMKIS